MSSSDESAPAARRNGEHNSESESSDDLLFKFPQRAFKRRGENSDSDGKQQGCDDDSDSDGDGMGGAFNSSPETSRRVCEPSVFSSIAAGSGSGGGAAGRVDLNAILSSDDEGIPLPMPAPKRRRRRRETLTAEQLDANANATVDALLESSDGGGSGSAPKSMNKKELAYIRKMQKQLADATKIDSDGGRGSRTRAGTAIHGAPAHAAAAAAAATDASEPLLAEIAARRERGQDKRRVTLTVVRSKRQRHRFNTKWGKSIGGIEESCRSELNLVSRDEEEDAEIALFYQDKKLDSSQTLRGAGVPEGNVTLRLEVTGGGGGSGGGTSGPPITIKVRVKGGKTFAVSTTTDTKFSALMEGFNSEVGIPPERAHESVFQFDGDKLSPDDTPEGQDMEDDELIEAKFPEDLMDGVQASPTEITLVAQKTKKFARKAGKGKGAARSSSAAAVAATAQPLGSGASQSSQSGTKRRTRGGGSGGGGSGSGCEREVHAMKQPEIVVLD